MSKVISTDSGTVFAALKLIEQLYRDEKIDQIIFRNIVQEYSTYVDTSRFLCAIHEKKE